MLAAGDETCFHVTACTYAVGARDHVALFYRAFDLELFIDFPFIFVPKLLHFFLNLYPRMYMTLTLWFGVGTT